MKLIERILHPTDFSNASEKALEQSLVLAKTFHSEILPIHVVPIVRDSPLTLEALTEVAQKGLAGVSEKIRNAGLTAQVPLVIQGSVHEGIIDSSLTHDVNVIVMAADSNPDNTPHPVGQNALRVVQTSEKPVWLVRNSYQDGSAPILALVDLSDSSKRALQNAIHLARTFNSRLIVLMVIQPLSFFYNALVQIGVEQGDNWIKQEHLKLDHFLSQCHFQNVSWEKIVRQGKPITEIIKVCQEYKPGLITMGTSQSNTLSRIIMGSLTEQILHEAPCSVITFRSDHAIRLKLDKEIKDIEQHLELGEKLYQQGFPAEALHHLNHCIQQDPHFAHAYEVKAMIHRALNQEEQAVECEEEAKMIRKRLWEQRVTAEMRRSNPLHGSD